MTDLRTEKRVNLWGLVSRQAPKTNRNLGKITKTKE